MKIVHPDKGFENVRNVDHPYWNRMCICRHARREHGWLGCMMASCDCKTFVAYDQETGSAQLMPYSYA